MSMRDYPIAENAAFLIDKEVGAYLLRAVDRRDGIVPGEIKDLSEEEFARLAREGRLPAEYSDIGIVYEQLERELVLLAPFTGEADPLCSERTKASLLSFYDDTICYLPSKKETSLFKAAYSCPDELLGEFICFFGGLHCVLPARFDWWGHIVSIRGTVYG